MSGVNGENSGEMDTELKDDGIRLNKTESESSEKRRHLEICISHKLTTTTKRYLVCIRIKIVLKYDNISE